VGLTGRFVAMVLGLVFIIVSDRKPDRDRARSWASPGDHRASAILEGVF
jgi:hypothetical protein